MAKRLIAAFEKDEEYAISAMKDMPKGRKSAMKVNFTFTFQQDNEKSMYSLSTNENGKIELSINISRSNSSNINVSQNWEREIEKWSKDVNKWTTDINKHVDELGCIVSKSIKYDEKNNRLVLEGDVYIDGKKMKKGNYKMNGREVIVQ
jgi:post-segregation antitoxin (ccd killing protein)